MRARTKVLTTIAFLSLVGCQTFQSTQGTENKAAAADVTKAVCVLNPTAGSEVQGIVTFEQRSGYVLVEADVTGLAVGQHGFHVHQWGDVSGKDGKKTGGHFNPEGHDHAGPDAMKRHAGDLGNLIADESGHASYRYEDKVITLNGLHSIVGRGVIVHAGADDLKSQPTGAAGARVAQGVIGVAD